MVLDRRVFSIVLLLAAGMLTIYLFLLVATASVAQIPDPDNTNNDENGGNTNNGGNNNDNNDDGTTGIDSNNGGSNNGGGGAGGSVEITQEFEQEAESGDVDQTFTVTGSGDNDNQCVNASGIVNTGNVQTQSGLVQFDSEIEAFEQDEINNALSVGDDSSVTCDQHVNQDAAAG